MVKVYTKECAFIIREIKKTIEEVDEENRVQVRQKIEDIEDEKRLRSMIELEWDTLV